MTSEPQEGGRGRGPLVVALLIGAALVGGLAYASFRTRTPAEMPVAAEQDFIEAQEEIGRLTEDVGGIEVPYAAEEVEETSFGTKDFTWEDFAFSYPAAWTAGTTEDGTTVLSEGDARKATVTCPTPTTGYEAWRFDRTDRTYLRDGKTFDASLWMGEPNEEFDTEEWMVLIFGRGESGAFGDIGCHIKLETSHPPTQAERDIAKRIFDSVR
ncbi:hypothetical protein L0Y59_00145 [Candidatus Uhrbacteria bacterium]|nr:hypothetical protein [Candidatus Uhrbacteria bacterium]